MEFVDVAATSFLNFSLPFATPAFTIVICIKRTEKHIETSTTIVKDLIVVGCRLNDD